MSDRDLIIAGAVGAVVLLWLARRQVGAAAYAISPTNPENIFYGGVNAVGGSISGDEHWTLGSWLYDLVNPAPSPAQTFYMDQLRAAGYPVGEAWGW